MKPLITIAMPVFNVEKYIKQAIVSVLEQTYENIEFLIIDDKGSDNSISIVNGILDKYNGNKKIRIITHETNRGLSEARNTAIKEATGEYIYFIDSDDFITNNCIEKLYQVIGMNNVDLVVGSYQRISEIKNKNDYNLILNKIILQDSRKIKEHIFQNIKKNYIGYVWNKLFKISFLKENNLHFIPNIYYEDDIYSLKTYTLANSCAHISDITYYYRQREGSIVHIGRGAFLEKEIKDISYTRNLEKEYLKEFFDYKYVENIILNISTGCFYNARAYQQRNANHIYIKPYIKNLLYYPLPLWKVLTIRRNFPKHLFFWTIDKLPYFIVKRIL